MLFSVLIASSRLIIGRDRVDHLVVHLQDLQRSSASDLHGLTRLTLTERLPACEAVASPLHTDKP